MIGRLRSLMGNDAPVFEIHFGGKEGEAAWNGEIRTRTANKRAEMYTNLRAWLEKGALPDQQRLADDLTPIDYSYNADNAILLEKEEHLRARGLPSSGWSDALALTFAAAVSPRSMPSYLNPDSFQNDKPFDRCQELEHPDRRAGGRFSGEPYKLTLPEGVELDADLPDQATPVLREIGLNDEQASKLARLAMQVHERVIKRQGDDLAELQSHWSRQALNDRQLGGRNWADTMRLSGAALDAGGAPKGSAFRNLLDESGLGNHPEAIRVFRRLGELIGRLPKRAATWLPCTPTTVLRLRGTSNGRWWLSTGLQNLTLGSA